jgi:hypothetical protein
MGCCSECEKHGTSCGGGKPTCSGNDPHVDQPPESLQISTVIMDTPPNTIEECKKQIETLEQILAQQAIEEKASLARLKNCEDNLKECQEALKKCEDEECKLRQQKCQSTIPLTNTITSGKEVPKSYPATYINRSEALSNCVPGTYTALGKEGITVNFPEYVSAVLGYPEGHYPNSNGRYSIIKSAKGPITFDSATFPNPKDPNWNAHKKYAWFTCSNPPPKENTTIPLCRTLVTQRQKYQIPTNDPNCPENLFLFPKCLDLPEFKEKWNAIQQMPPGEERKITELDYWQQVRAYTLKQTECYQKYKVPCRDKEYINVDFV